MSQPAGKFSTAAKTAMPWLGLAIKLVVVPAAGVILIWTFISGETASRLSHPGVAMALAIALNEIGLILTALRMRSVLAVFSIRLKILQSIKIHLQSLMYFFVIPGSVGMEIARFAKLRANAQVTSSTNLAFAVLGDRLIGVATAVVIVAATLPLIGLPVNLLFNAGMAMVLAAGLAAGAGLAFFLRRYEPVQQLFAVGMEMLQRPAAAFVLLILSIAAQLASSLAVFLAAISIGVSISPMVLVFGLSASILSMIIPVSLVGAGPAEAVAVGIFIALGYSASDAVLIASLAYASRLVGALQGAVLEIIEGGMTLRAALRSGSK